MISFYSIQIYKLNLKHWAFSNTQLRAMIKAVYLCSYFSILHPIVCSILFCQDFKMYFTACVLIRQKMLRNESCIWKKKGSSLPFPYFSKLPYRIFFWPVTFILEIIFLFSLTELLLADFWESGAVPLIPRGMDSSAGQRWGAGSSQ